MHTDIGRYDDKVLDHYYPTQGSRRSRIKSEGRVAEVEGNAYKKETGVLSYLQKIQGTPTMGSATQHC